ncbi:MAG TPA: ArsA-related P-loop ATPase [Conexibacter sp.]|jgi:anion-transporting  ArsA/GET3 family ATPase
MTGAGPGGNAMTGAAELLDGVRVCVCGGSGGVGKTTTSAAIAAGMAARGLTVCVVTIDPAQRLADALGLDTLGNEPVRVDGAPFAAAGMPLDGELWALQLDPKRTFDDLIGRLSPDDRTRDAILSDRIYGQLSGAVAGSQEFTAIAKLHDLAASGRFDLLVLDTPPSRNALDFLEAPDRLRQFFDGRALQTLLRPSGFGMRLIARPAGMALSVLKRVTGVELLSDLSSFFRLLGGLMEGFRARAAQVEALLHDPTTRFLLVTSPEREPIEEAIYFQRRLNEAHMGFGGGIVNRVHDDHLGDLETAGLPTRIADETGLSLALSKQVLGAFLGEHTLALRDRANVDHLSERLGPDVPLLLVPHLDDDVHDAPGLVRVGRYLFDGA